MKILELFYSPHISILLMWDPPVTNGLWTSHPKATSSIRLLGRTHFSLRPFPTVIDCFNACRYANRDDVVVDIRENVLNSLGDDQFWKRFHKYFILVNFIFCNSSEFSVFFYINIDSITLMPHTTSRLSYCLKTSLLKKRNNT